MKRFFYIMSAVFSITLAVVIGLRMSADAMAVIIGIICGMLATVPTTLLLLYALRQKESQQNETRHQAAHYPPVVVVNSPPGQSGYGMASAGLNNQALLPQNGERSFKVVGQDAAPTETLGSAFGLNSIWDEVN